MRVYRIPCTPLIIKGNAFSLLNGITSNTMEAALNAFLNQHGRIIATFYQNNMSSEECLISVPTLAKDDLLKHLERYARLSHTRVETLSQDVFMDLDTLRTVVLPGPVTDSISDEDFRLLRLVHRIPLMGVDYQADEFILNVHEQDYVSYTKGCYLGQEPVSKVHHRAQPSRKLVVRYEDECAPEVAVKMTSRAVDPANGRVKGFIFVNNK